jgi:hypothetical protein
LTARDFGLDGLAQQLVDEVLDSLVIARSELQRTSPASK